MNLQQIADLLVKKRIVASSMRAFSLKLVVAYHGKLILKLNSFDTPAGKS